MLTDTKKRLVQETFATIAPIADDAAALVYRRLFDIDPSLKRMFKDDMTEQRKRLMQIDCRCRAGLDRLDELVPAVQDLGRRHAVTASRTATTTRSARRCCGRSRRGSGRPLLPKQKKRGQRFTAFSRRR